MRQSHGGEHMEAVHLVLATDIRLVKIIVVSETGVVDEQFEIFRRRGEALFHSRQSFVGSEIGRKHLRCDGMMRLPQRISHLLQPVLAPAHEYEIIAPSRELARKLRADTARRASDQSKSPHSLTRADFHSASGCVKMAKRGHWISEVFAND
jgi:hypothetical protein